MELNESLLSSSGFDILLAETILDEHLSDSLADAMGKVDTLLVENDVNADVKYSIINLRNEEFIAEALKTDEFVSKQLKPFTDLFFKKSVAFTEGYSDVYKINLVLGTDYKVSDVFVGSKIIQEGADVNITYDNLNLSIVNTYRSRLEYYSTACKDCLYEGLYDESTLVEFLPTLCFLDENI